MPPKLTVTAGPSYGVEVPLSGRIIFNIGSDRASTVFIDDPHVSPNHCRLYNEESRFTLFDVSGQGMQVNGKRVVKAHLQDGDVIHIGGTELRFTQVDRAGGGAPPPPYAPPHAPPLHAPPQPHYPPPPGPTQHAPPPPGAPPSFRMDLRGGGGASGLARVWLHCIEGNDKGKCYDLSEGSSWVLGRGHSADITVMDIKVSRAHTRIERQGDTFFVSDLNSTNGTFVNGQQIERQELRRGDYVKLGYTILAFQLETAEESAGGPARDLDPAVLAGLHDEPFAGAAPPAPPPGPPPAPVGGPPPWAAAATDPVGPPSPEPPAGGYEDIELNMDALEDDDPFAGAAPASPPRGAGVAPRGNLRTMDVVVPDLDGDEDLLAAPSAPPAQAMRCFLCSRTFDGQAVARGQLRRIQDNYYCLGCLQGS